MTFINSAKLVKLVLMPSAVKGREEHLDLSSRVVDINEQLENFLIGKFSALFNNSGEFVFYHPNALHFNFIYSITKDLKPQSGNELIAYCNDCSKFLYEQSQNPQIKAGYLMFCFFVDSESDAFSVAIVKFEDSSFSFTVDSDSEMDIHNLTFRKVVDFSNLDKAVLIEVKGEDTEVFLPRQTRAAEAKFWNEDFLSVKPKPVPEVLGKDIIQMAKQYITANSDSLERVNAFSKKTHTFIEELKDSDRETNAEQFLTSVLDNEDDIRGIMQVKEDFEEQHYGKSSGNAVLSFSNKSIKETNYRIKIDANVEVKVTGNAPFNYEQGFDHDMDKAFIKIFFDRITFL
ncbi:MAG: nucleoid-associated protein [Bacteroidota bacterium]